MFNLLLIGQACELCSCILSSTVPVGVDDPCRLFRFSSFLLFKFQIRKKNALNS
uniref:Uncharacterized protein n=1 Tax=Oryza brachyantha TaxID=4533 RepID=J3L6K5_ORYBR